MPIVHRLCRPSLAGVALLLAAACSTDSGDRVKVTVDGSGTGSGTVQAPDPTVGIDCRIDAGTAGTPECSSSFEDAGGGGNFDLGATPDAGSAFTSWTGCNFTSGTICTLAFDAAQGGDVEFNVTATFTATSAACNNPLIIQDQFALDAGWSVTPVVNSGSPTQTAAFQATGGNPGGYRQMQHIFPGDGEIYVYHYYGTTRYNPSTQGAIDHINYSENQIVLTPPFAGADIGAGFVMNQGSIPYLVVVPSTGPFSNTVWQTAQVPDVVAADFVGLNFSATGGEITFGYYRANTHIGGGALTLTHGMDNWRVEICR